MRPRHIAAVALILALTAAGFVIARLLAERDARRESERRVAVAGAQIQSRIEVATSLTESLSQFMSDTGPKGVTNDQFTKAALRWLSPAGLPAAAWAEEVRAADRPTYERRIGRPIVAPDERQKAVPAGFSYLPATLISGFPPMNTRGIDLRLELGIAAALDRAVRPGGVGATTIATRSDGTRGLFFVAPAPNLINGVLRPGAVVVFLSEATLRGAARSPAGLEFAPADSPSPGAAGGDDVRDDFAVAGQQFAVVLPKESVSGPGAVLPWIVLAGGLLLTVLAGALGVIAARRARTQQDFDRIFNLSADLVVVANFDGHFTRVNPAATQVLGYSEKELLARPYLDFVHPDDRAMTLAEVAEIAQGKTAISFENRLVRKDGSLRAFEWTGTPVVADGVMYGMARDVTDRRRAETESKRLADEQSALRRVAELVASQASPEEVFELVTEELSCLLGADLMVRTVRFEPDGSASILAARGQPQDLIPPGANTPRPEGGVLDQVFRTGRPGRIDDYGPVTGPLSVALREEGMGSAAAGPIVVDGQIWGAMAVASRTTLPPATEDRVAEFAELVSTAISNIESRAKVERLAAEQSALRRVAELVARQAPPEEVFSLVTRELSHLLGASLVRTVRFEPDGTATLLAGHGMSADRIPLGTNMPLPEGSVIEQVFRTGRPARVEDYSQMSGPIGAVLREEGARGGVGGPIVVDGRTWGAMAVGSWETLPAGSEDRVARFAELVSTAISNIESRAKVERLAAEQSALRRVATLVARDPASPQFFSTVAREAASVLNVPGVIVTRYESDGTAVTFGEAFESDLANAGRFFGIGARMGRDPGSLAAQVFDTHRAARVDDFSSLPGRIGDLARAAGFGSGCAGPIVVDGDLWGKMCVFSPRETTLPVGTENRLHDFVELIATAIANHEARADLAASETRARELATEQAALRRVATLVAQGASPDELFSALAEEVGVLLDVDATSIMRFEPDSTATVVAAWSERAIKLPLGERLPLEGENLSRDVLRTGKPQRKEDYSATPGPIASTARELGIHSAVASPIVVEGTTWGVIAVARRTRTPLPPGTEARIAEFSRHAGMAVANAKSRSDLAQSRARIVRAGDDARRRFEHDLHDGAQQRLVSLAMDLSAAEATTPPELGDLRGVLSHVGTGLRGVLDDLRELSRGLHPSVLSEGGLGPALRSLARRSAVPVDLQLGVGDERFEEPVEVAAYYVASETLANAAKHANASRAEVTVRQSNGWLELIVTDDGRGGADPSNGSGLTGLVDRVEALGGKIQIDSRPHRGTGVHVKIPTGSTD